MWIRHKCIDIDECKEFPGLCEGKLHCTNTIGTYTCGCRHGYETIKTSDWDLMMTIPDCKDIDECSNQDICPFNSDCQNTAGNYTCECNTGFDGYLCEDIDECNKVSSCHANSSCSNSYGNFTCSCNSGFRGDGKTCQEGECDDRSCPSGKQCVSPTTNDCECKPGFSQIKSENFCRDIDECVNTEVCPDSAVCMNTEGSYTCQCDKGFIYEGDLCVDIDECFLISSCDPNATCSNTYGNFMCSCNEGFHGDGEICVKGSCEDILCPINAKCVSPGYECECQEGFILEENINLCVDTDECLLNHDCDINSICANSEGSYACTCESGYFGNGKTCDVGSCTDDICPLNEECVSPTSSDCQCKSGFERNATDACVDTDECSTSMHFCEAKRICVNSEGSYNCECQAGYFGNGKFCTRGSCSDVFCPENEQCVSPRKMDCRCANGFSRDEADACVDIDECSSGLHVCDKNAICSNELGGYSCLCKSGFTGSGLSCSDSNE